MSNTYLAASDFPGLQDDIPLLLNDEHIVPCGSVEFPRPAELLESLWANISGGSELFEIFIEISWLFALYSKCKLYVL